MGERDEKCCDGKGKEWNQESKLFKIVVLAHYTAASMADFSQHILNLIITKYQGVMNSIIFCTTLFLRYCSEMIQIKNGIQHD